MGMKDTKYEVEERNLFVELCSEIDHHQVTAIANEINHYMQRTLSKNIIFDFRRVSFMDSSGIGLVMGAYKQAVRLGGAVMVCNLSKKVDRVFRVSGVYRFVRCLN